VARRTITCVAPSKTFNLAGLSTSSVIIPGPDLRHSFNSLIDKLHIGSGNIFGTTASIAAYTDGYEWLNELIRYIEGNIKYVIDYLNTMVPEIVPVPPEATYMIWLDCRKLGMTGKELQDFFIRSARVGMNEGSAFGPGGEGFMRMNVGCQRLTVVRAMEQIRKAVAGIR
jgi:cystathionine beta-lyase